MGGSTFDTIVTDASRRAFVDEMFGHRFEHEGSFFLPDASTYNSLHSSQHLHAFAISTLRWIGSRQPGISVNYGSTRNQHGYLISTSKKQIIIDTQLEQHPLECAAVTILAVLDYITSKSRSGHASPELLTYSAVALGMGVYLLNAAATYKHQTHQFIRLRTANTHFPSLGAISAHQIAEQVLSFAHEYRIPNDEFTGTLTVEAQRMLPSLHQSGIQSHLPLLDAQVLHRRESRQFWMKLILTAALISTAVIMSIVLFNLSSTPTSTDISQQSAKILQQKQLLDSCINEAQQQQNSYDPNDLFMTRQINATKSKCESLRNEYNYAVDQYNASLSVQQRRN